MHIFIYLLCTGVEHYTVGLTWCESTYVNQRLTYPAGLSVFSLVDSRGEPKCHH